MTTPEFKQLFPDIDPSQITFFPLLEQFHEGVIVTDDQGVILYMNHLQEKLDDLNLSQVIGKSVREVYRVDADESPATACLKTGKRVNNIPCFYRTSKGKVVNSIHNVVPLHARGKLIGTVCFIRAYSLLEQDMESFRVPEKIQYIRESDRSHLKTSINDLGNGTRYTFDDIIGQSPGFLDAVEASRLASGSASTVMLFGETGTGKELFAQSIHNKSSRRQYPYVALNCAAIPENLLEGILFGTAKGAFTGSTDKPGLFQKANGGTLFLDEINSMPMGLQAKLLRVLQERKIRRVGALEETLLDLKIISSVNEDPHDAVTRGSLRADLLYRLGVVFIRIPPLRERSEDMDPLLFHFISKFNRIMGKTVHSVSPEVMHLFRSYSWQGNVRELEHVIEGAMNMVKDYQTILTRHLSVHIGDLPSVARTGIPQQTPLPEPGEALSESRQSHEIRVIRNILNHTHGNVARAARELKLSPQLLHYKLKKYGIQAADFKPLLKSK